MTLVDVALLILLLLFAVRGFLRGFFRESFGFFGLVMGIGVALQFTEVVAARVSAELQIPEPLPAAISFIGLFMLVYTSLNLFGLLLDRLTTRYIFRFVNRMAGAAFGVGKGGAIIAFVLLFVHLFKIAPSLDPHIMNSELARPLIAVAEAAIREGWREAEAVKAKQA